MSVKDGGSFKCYNHKEVFETVDPKVWGEHIDDGKHTDSGSAPCAICGNITNYQHKPIDKKPMCDKCKGDYLK